MTDATGAVARKENLREIARLIADELRGELEIERISSRLERLERQIETGAGDAHPSEKLFSLPSEHDATCCYENKPCDDCSMCSCQGF